MRPVQPRSRSGEARGGGEVDVERVYRHRPTAPLDPETGQLTGERAHVALATCAMKVVAEVDVDPGCGPHLADAIGNLADFGITARRVILIGGAARSEAVRRIATEAFRPTARSIQPCSTPTG